MSVEKINNYFERNTFYWWTEAQRMQGVGRFAFGIDMLLKFESDPYIPVLQEKGDP